MSLTGKGNGPRAQRAGGRPSCLSLNPAESAQESSRAEAQTQRINTVWGDLTFEVVATPRAGDAPDAETPAVPAERAEAMAARHAPRGPRSTPQQHHNLRPPCCHGHKPPGRNRLRAPAGKPRRAVYALRRPSWLLLGAYPPARAGGGTAPRAHPRGSGGALTGCGPGAARRHRARMLLRQRCLRHPYGLRGTHRPHLSRACGGENLHRPSTISARLRLSNRRKQVDGEERS